MRNWNNSKGKKIIKLLSARNSGKNKKKKRKLKKKLILRHQNDLKDAREGKIINLKRIKVKCKALKSKKFLNKNKMMK
jgi:hypothetical protein